MNITELRELVLQDNEATYYTKNLELYLSLNLWLHLQLVDRDIPGRDESITLVETLLIELVNRKRGTEIDLIRTLSILHPTLNPIDLPNEFAYSFNRYYRIELDCFGNRGSIRDLFVVLFDQHDGDEKILSQIVKRLLQGYLESVKADSRRLLGIN